MFVMFGLNSNSSSSSATLHTAGAGMFCCLKTSFKGHYCVSLSVRPIINIRRSQLKLLIKRR